MNNSIFDLEQEIMHCWNVVDDIKVITTWFADDPSWEGIDGTVQDAIMNKYFGIQELYDVKFQKLFQTFEKVCKEYHTYRKLSDVDRQEELVRSFNEQE